MDLPTHPTQCDRARIGSRSGASLRLARDVRVALGAFLLLLWGGASILHAAPPQPPDFEAAYEARDLGPVEVWLETLEPGQKHSADGLHAQAWIDRRAGEAERALARIDQAIAIEPENPALYLTRASVLADGLSEAGMFGSMKIARRVRDELLRAHQVDPDDIDALVALAGFDLRAPGIVGANKKRGRELIARLHSIAPERAFALQGQIDAAAGEFKQAVESMDRAIARCQALGRGAPPKWWYRLALWHAELDQIEAALAALERALDIAPEFAPALYERAELALQAERGVSAGIDAVRRYLTIPPWPGDPDHASAMRLLAGLHRELGQDRRAEQALARAEMLEQPRPLGPAIAPISSASPD